MNPAQSLELGFLEALDANGQAIDAQCPVSDEFLLFESPRVGFQGDFNVMGERSEEHTSELQSLMRISYAVFCLKKNITLPHKTERAKLLHNRSNTLDNTN